MSLQIYIGPMFAGKSSEILRIVNRYKAIQKQMCILSYSGDNRYTSDDILMNHNSVGVPCIKVDSICAILQNENYRYVFENASLVIVDEAQFFDELCSFVKYVVEDCHKDLVLVGLDGDANRKPFGDLLECIPLADEVVQLKALCSVCNDGTDALFTFCKQNKAEQVCIGGAELYMPVCRKHYLQKMNQ
jgi:thymidine kinase